MKKIVSLSLLLLGLFAPWTTEAQQHLNLYENETETCNQTPITCGSFFYWSRAQTVFPASDLVQMTGGTITEITFYTAPTEVPYNINPDLTSPSTLSCVYLTEVTSSSISDYLTLDEMAENLSRYNTPYHVIGVNSYNFEVVDGIGMVTISLGDGFEYHGGNLLFGWENLTSGISFISPNVNFYGKTAPGASINGVSYSYLSPYGTVPIGATQRNFLPRTTFTYTGGTVCPRPSHLAVDFTSTNGTTATASWSDNGGSQWEIELTGPTGTTTYTTNTNTYTFTGLTPEQHYSVRVRRGCSCWTESVDFIPSTHIPVGAGTSSSQYLPFTATHNYSLTEQLYAIDELGAAGDIQTIDLYKIGSGACTRNLEIYMISTSTREYLPNSIHVNHVRISPDDLVFSGTVTFAGNTWTTITLDTPFEYNGVNNVFLVVHDNTGSGGANDVKFLTDIGGDIFDEGNPSHESYPYQPDVPPPYYQSLYYANNTTDYTPVVGFGGNYGSDYDDPELSFHNYYKNQIRITKSSAPSCFKPIEVRTYEVYATEAELRWYDPNGGANSWEVQYSTSPDFTTDVQTMTVYDNSCWLSNLNDRNTTYYVRVRAVCGSNSYSRWSSSISFITQYCDYSERCDIEYWLCSSDPWGWNNAGILVIDDYTGDTLDRWTHPGNYDIGDKSSNGYIYRSGFGICEGQTIQFHWTDAVYDDEIGGYDEDYSDNDENNENNETNETTYSFVVYDVNYSVIFSGTGPFSTPSSYLGSCTQNPCENSPTEIHVVPNGNTATVTWEGEAVSYNIMLDGIVVARGVTDHTYTFSGLELSTTYTVQIQANCGSQEGLSSWTYPVRFATDNCMAENKCTISYELIDDYGNSMDGYELTVWDNSTHSYMSTWSFGDNPSYTSGTLSLCDGSTIYIEWNGYFDSDLEGIWRFKIYDANNNVTEIDLDELYNNGYITYTVNCTPAACPPPTNLTVSNIGAHTATLTWSGNASSYNISLNNEVVATGITTNTYTFSNLTMNTFYSAQVVSVCGTDGTSNPTLPARFTTDPCEDMCIISYDLYDLGDYRGWYYNRLEVWDVTDAVDPVQLTEWYIRDYSDHASGTLKVCNGHQLQFSLYNWYWSTPRYTEYCSYTVYDVNHVEIFSGSGSITDPINYTVNCSDCLRPSGLVANNITPQSAILSWVGNAPQYKVRYRTVREGYTYFTDFEGGMPEGWTHTNIGYQPSNPDFDWQWQNEGLAHSGTGHMYCPSSLNYGSYVSNTDNWLISPQLDLGGTLKFWMRNQAQNDYGERFYVKISTTGNEINLTTFNRDLLANQYASNSYTEYTADLSSYAGQQGYIAIRYCDGHSDNGLNLDDFGLFGIIRGEWVETTVTGNQLNLAGLASETNYEWQVKAFCDVDDVTEWSAIASFTTTPNAINIAAGRWYAISAPSHDEGYNYLSISNLSDLTSATYDLFRYNEGAAKWENQKTENNGTGFSTLDLRRGYIYRRAADATIYFGGIPNGGNYTTNYRLTNSSTDNDLKGFNLIGNPYQHTIYKGGAFPATNLTQGYYALAPDGTWRARQDSEPIGFAQGVLVKVVNGVEYVDLTFSDTPNPPVSGSKGNDERVLLFSVTDSRYTDVAYAMLAASDASEGLPKIAHLNTEAPSLSITLGGTDYSIALLEPATEAFQLKFRAILSGEYTISLQKAKEMGLEYVHLIDRITGADIDLLHQPTYTFTHTRTLAADRFLVKLSPNAVYNPTDQDTPFAHWADGVLVVEGSGPLQVYDVMGRLLYNRLLTTDNYQLPATIFPVTGVYILRLNGKSQKVVVK